MTIPAELFELPQWVLWRYEDRGGDKPTKVPYNPNTGHPASVTDPSHWSTWQGVANGHAAGYNGRGIVVTEADGYTYFDLDDPFSVTIAGELVQLPENDPDACSVAASHLRIVDHLNSYTEWSPSGRGIRIIVRGKLPDGWRNRIGKVEIYSKERYLTLTGNHIAETPLTIEPRQKELEDVARALGLDKALTLGDAYPELDKTRSHEQVFQAICGSKIGNAFMALYNGDASGYSSGSEADLALANYICAFTDSKEQARTIFKCSVHFQRREKLHARPELVERVINKGFDRKPPPIDVSALKATADALAATRTAEIRPDPQLDIAMPPGITGFICDYIMRTSPRPIFEFALAGAIGLMGGICGRSYNINGAGLNQYIAMIGPTGMGKDAVPNGISKLLGEISETVESAVKFQGPRGIASAPALYKCFDRERGGSPSFVCLLPEFGEWLETHSSERADSTKRDLIAAIMELYGKSGFGAEAGSIAYSKREDNVKTAKSPALTIIGDTIADTFYDACTERNIRKGLVSRMLLIEYKGRRPRLNALAHHFRANSDWLAYTANFVQQCHALNEKSAPVNVPLMADAEAELMAFNDYCDNAYNNDMGNAARGIWSRAYLKALKLAALLAVGENFPNPVVTIANVMWAIKLVKHDVNMLLARINSGEIETRNDAQSYSIEQRSIAAVYLAHMAKPHDKLNAQHRAQMTEGGHNAGYLRASVFRNMCMLKPTFRKDFRMRDKRYDDAMKSLEGVLAVQLGNAVPSNVPVLGLKADTRYVIATDLDELKRMSEEL